MNLKLWITSFLFKKIRNTCLIKHKACQIFYISKNLMTYFFASRRCCDRVHWHVMVYNASFVKERIYFSQRNRSVYVARITSNMNQNLMRSSSKWQCGCCVHYSWHSIITCFLWTNWSYLFNPLHNVRLLAINR